ncbi:hypothetical protein [Nesterenkonia alkaliphila]|uniref:Tetratricopeptide repeat protein n=1 Tax=Nesterenkonia alkaliphila TaxID=1463631 RepID=A0A7K1UIB4_9MICC|nr:hypothetical protein [Nesterenkonia alkaliphila]MVT26210.1 hypothetical protein [Nesterenkonia alkaliphila]GFZ84483.1 hypothetical protein GCM10011359_11770 [Nesterenkonia alkaliphila]
MKDKIWTWVMIALVGIVMAGAVSSAVRFLRVDDAVARLLGAGTLVLVAVGVWFLWHAISFGLRTERLGRILDAEGGLPEDTVERSPAGRPNRAQADEQFARFKAEAEAAPEDWRVWYRLAYAYDVAGDRARARRTMKRAITMHRNGTE